jgi:hypothetical protein
MRNSILRGVLAVAAIGVVACGGNEDHEAAPPDSLPLYTLRGVPMFPGARLLGIEGGADAAQATVSIPLPVDSVARWYRRALLELRWHIASDVPTPDGGVSLHVESTDGRPVWLLITPTADRTGTVVSAIGAVRDTTAARPEH